MIQDHLKKKILVVEDEPNIGRAYRRILAAQGFEVDIAINGIAAIAMVTDKEYDLCLSDIRTPGMNGIDFYRHLEKNRHCLANKVIFATGDTLSGNTELFLQETKRPVLIKPFSPDELIGMIEGIIAEPTPYI
jgi:CheY-like chemotaxis protein